MRTFVLAALAAFAVVAAPAAAQTDDCPHTGVRTVDLPDRVQGRQACSTGFSGSIGGIQIQTPQSICPVWLLVLPPRDVPESRPGSNTYAYPNGNVIMKIVFFECATSHFLIIPTGEYCTVADVQNMGTLTNYASAPCSRRHGDIAD